MHIKLLLFIGILWSGMSMHGGHTAEFHYHIEGERLILQFMIDKHDLSHLDIDNGCDFDAMTALCVSKYIMQHSSMTINDKEIEFSLQKSYTDGGQLFVILSSPWEATLIKSLTIQNECFYAYDAEFKNRIILDMGRFDKSYLLNKDNKKLLLK